MSTHTCPGECGTQVPRHHYACRSCWYRLPEHLRDAIREHHRPRTLAHAVAMYNAHTWYVENPLPSRETR